MKTMMCFCFALFLMNPVLFARKRCVLEDKQAKEAEDGNNFAVGIRAGPTYNTLRTRGSVSENKAWLLGYQAGVVVHFPLGELLAIQTEINYTQRGLQYKYEGDYDRLKMSYAEIPVLIKYQSYGDPFSVFGYAGGYAAYWLKGKLESKSNGETNRLAYSFDNGLGDGYADNRLDYGAIAGAGVKINAGPGSIIVDARYLYGLADISKINPSPDGYTKSPHRGVSLSVGYLFRF